MNRTRGPQLALKPAPELAVVARAWLVVVAELGRRAALAGPGPDVAQEALQQHVQPGRRGGGFPPPASEVTGLRRQALTQPLG